MGWVACLLCRFNFVFSRVLQWSNWKWGSTTCSTTSSSYHDNMRSETTKKHGRSCDTSERCCNSTVSPCRLLLAFAIFKGIDLFVGNRCKNTDSRAWWKSKPKTCFEVRTMKKSTQGPPRQSYGVRWILRCNADWLAYTQVIKSSIDHQPGRAEPIRPMVGRLEERI